MELFEHWHSVGVGGVKPSASGVDTLKKVFLIYCYNCYLAEYVISVRLDAEFDIRPDNGYLAEYRISVRPDVVFHIRPDTKY